MLIKIFDEQDLMSKLEMMRKEFDRLKNNVDYLGELYPIIERVENWKYCTGALFDQPLYGAQMAGFDPGRVLKKQYKTPFDARVKGAYSSGFIDDVHVVTVFPAKPDDMPLEASFYLQENDVIKQRAVTLFDAAFSRVIKPPVLRGISETYIWKEKISAYVSVGARNAYAIILYYIGEDGMVEKASMVTGPFDFQDNFDFIYDEGGLARVMSNGLIWERK